MPGHFILFRFTCILGIICSVSSCRPGEEVGLAQYSIYNQSDYDLKIRCIYSAASVVVACDSCNIPKHTSSLLGYDGNFGYAPPPNETIATISVYLDDTLKLELNSPFADSVWTKEKGTNTYDWNFNLQLDNSDIN